MTAEQVLSANVPEPAGRFYSQAVKANSFLFVSGQVAVDGDGNLVGKGDVLAQTRQALANIRSFTEAAGARIDDVVKITVFLRYAKDAPAIRPLRAEVFTGPFFPATTLLGGADLADPDWLVEIEAIVAL